MAQFYREDRGHPFVRYITAPRAAKLLEDARADRNAAAEGALDDPDGFTFWSGWHESTGPMVRVRVRPVPREHIPPVQLAMLETAPEES